MFTLFPNNKDVEKILGPVLVVSVLVSFLAGLGGGIAAGALFSQLSFGDLGHNFLFTPRDEELDEKTGEPETYEPQLQDEKLVIDAVKNASPSVVSIIVTKDLPVLEQYYIDPFEGLRDPFGNDFFAPFRVPQYREKGTEKREIGGGTGFVISQDGLILTNKHVVADTEADYTVLTNDGDRLEATVLARDPIQDLAVIKIEKIGLPALSLGNSDTIQIGQSVIAIGNALGEFRNTVSIGVISGLKRTITAIGGGVSETIDEVIQTDAAINPGNSGGPLLNLKGEVIGINTAIAEGAENIGFAIPINKAKRDIEQVRTRGKITYPFLGVRYVLINRQIQETNKLSVDYGALIIRGERPEDLAVVPESPADKAGLGENDIILEVDGVKVNQENTLAKLIQNHSVGDIITLKVLSKGQERTIRVVLGENE